MYMWGTAESRVSRKLLSRAATAPVYVSNELCISGPPLEQEIPESLKIFAFLPAQAFILDATPHAGRDALRDHDCYLYLKPQYIGQEEYAYCLLRA
jgi:hypothetical protein